MRHIIEAKQLVSFEQTLIAKHLENNGQSLPKMLYHYTSIDGLMGILGSNSIWASNIRYLNDKTEFTSTIEKLEKECGQLFKGRARDRFKKALFDFFKGSEILEKFDIYVFSFSEEGDLLSQWRGYCLNCGFSIGFDFSGLEKLKSKLPTWFLLPCFYYDDKKYRKELVELIGETFDVMVQTKSQNDMASDEKIIKDILRDHTERIMQVGAIFKSNSFSAESEWRLIHFRKKDDNLKDIKFRKGNSMIIPYIEFGVENKYTNTPIKEIIIGPAPYQSLSKESVEKLLDSKKMKCTVTKSKIPFRKL